MATIEHKGGNKWLLKVSDGVGIDGKRRRPTRMFEGTEKQAQKAAILFEEEVKRGKYCEAGKGLTFSAYLKDIWAPAAEKNLAPKTYARYQELLTRIIPEIGHMKLEKIRPVTVRNLIITLEDSPRQDGKGGTLSPRTILHHYRCLSSILQEAVELDMISDNPCRRVKPPKVTKTEAKCYDEEQTELLLKALEGESLKHRALIYLAIASGAREGEIMGLEWSHIDFRENTITIEQASQYLVGKGTYKKDTKNKSSNRIISMPQNVMDLLKAYRAEWAAAKLEAGDLWQGTDRLFPTWDGRPGYPGWPEKWLHKFLERKGLEHIPFHSLRHLSATLLIKEGVPLKNVSKRLGHSVIGTTADIYAHALESVDKQAARKIGKALEQQAKKKKRAK
jgi:integrase